MNEEAQWLQMEIERREDQIDQLKEILQEIIDCPAWIDPATIPKNGIEANPSQVVYSYSIGYTRIQKAKQLLEEIK
jgi:hypothetical protein